MTPIRGQAAASAQRRKPRAGGQPRDAPDAPRGLRAGRVTAASVVLEWRAPKLASSRRSANGARKLLHPHVYRVFRNGKVVGRVHGTRFVDAHGLAPASAYRYTVRAYPRHGRAGHHSRVLVVRTSAFACAPGTPPFAITASTGMTSEMVDRLLWRAGFGPSDADRHAWIGRKLGELVDWLLSAPQSYVPTQTPPLTDRNGAIDPLVTNDELVLEWLDRMQRSANPFFARMNFFWHRHWAVSRNDGVPAAFLLAYRNRLYRYSDFAANPQASFRALALEMTTQDAAMSLFLNGYQNVKGRPNENYAREFMELFCLGANDLAGNPNYSQNDVQQLARAFTGWRLDNRPSSSSYGGVSFDPSSYDAGSKTILGRTGNFDAPAAVDVVLAHPSHGPHIVTKLWSELIASPIPPATLADLVATYTAGAALLLAPVLRKIMLHPLMFESLCEPNLVKPPIVHMVGVMRALGVPLKGSALPRALGNMQQTPYAPPNVAGWEGGLSWLNSSTAEARFDAVVRAQNLRYGGYPGTSSPPDLPRETPQDAFARAYASAGSPWLSERAQQILLAYAHGAPAASAAQRRQRFYALQASILGGPDGQVM